LPLAALSYFQQQIDISFRSRRMHMLKGTRRLQRVVVIAAVAIAFGLGGVVDQSIAQDNMKKDDMMKKDDKMKSSDKVSGDKMKSGDTMMKDDKKGDMKAGEVRKDDKMMPGDKTMEKK
jgi:pentapeptide MXKDX repeat protein